MLLPSAALAQTLSLSPGRLIQAAPCEERPSARCWREAQVIQRFAGKKRSGLAAKTKDVRLAWDNGALLLRASGLTEGEHLEITVSKTDAEDFGTAQLFTARNGVARHRLRPAIVPGEVRAVRIVLRDESDGSSRVWAPISDGDLTRPSLLWFTNTVRATPELAIQVIYDQSKISGSDDAFVEIKHRRPDLPAGGKGISAPWSTEAKVNSTIDAPSASGWFDIRQSGPDGLEATWSAFWTASPTDALTHHGLHPAPKKMSDPGPETFMLEAAAQICANGAETAGEWLLQELTRLTGLRPRLSCSEASSIRFVSQTMDHAEGYRVHVRKDHIEIASSGNRGALHGAIAVADLIGLDARAPTVTIEDWPAVSRRLLFQEVTPHSGPMTTPGQVVDFIERAVVRARFNTLVLELKGGLQSAHHPKLSRKDAWTRDDLGKVLESAERYGITVIPTFNTPAHSEWIGRVYPDLTEDETTGLLCTRHPETKRLVEDMLTELHEAFGQPDFVHIGHDEIGFKTHRKHEAQRCPRCEGTPRWQLLTEDLTWQHEVLSRLGAKPMMWSDMLIREWHGKHGAMYRAADRLDEDLRPDFNVISWGRVGDTVGTLVPKGYTVIRGNTGYADWKREGLQRVLPGITGEALAIFNPIPWSSFDGAGGETRLYHHWTNVMLAGATAWSPKIEETDIETSLRALADHPAYLPGFRAWPAGHRWRMFKTRQVPAVAHDLQLPPRLRIGDAETYTSVFFQLEHGESERFNLQKRLYGISVVQGVTHTVSARTLTRAHNQSLGQRGMTVGELRVTYDDGSTVNFPLIHGMNTNVIHASVRGSMLFDGSGAAGIPTQDTALTHPSAIERYLYRADWHNPRPQSLVHHVEVRATQPGVTLWVGGMGMALTPATQGVGDQ